MIPCQNSADGEISVNDLYEKSDYLNPFPRLFDVKTEFAQDCEPPPPRKVVQRVNLIIACTCGHFELELKPGERPNFIKISPKIVTQLLTSPNPSTKTAKNLNHSRIIRFDMESTITQLRTKAWNHILTKIITTIASKIWMK